MCPTIPAPQAATPLPGPLPPARLQVLGVPVDSLTYDDLLDTLARWIGHGDRTHQICTVGPEFIMIAQDEPEFMRVLQAADLCVPDGIGLLLAAQLLERRLPERVTGSDGVPMIAQRAAREGWRLFLLGAAPGVAERASERLQADFPALRIAGCYAGSPAVAEEAALVERINSSGAELLFVAYGAPQQDLWISRNAPRLEVRVAMGVGGTLDFIAGTVPRAPRWLQRLGMEWAFRLYKQPWRWRRMLRLPRFVWAVLRYRSQPVPKR